MENLTAMISRTSLDSTSSETTTSTFAGSEGSTTTTESYLNNSVSEIISATEHYTFSDIVSRNDRSREIRDARLAQALLSLDEDVPQDIDDNIKHLLKTHELLENTTLGHMAFLAEEDYLDYKSTLAAKRALEKPLPKSKSRKPILLVKNRTRQNPRTSVPFQPTPTHLLARNSRETKFGDASPMLSDPYLF